MRAERLGEALQQAGFDQFEHQLTTVLANYFRSGGTDERLQQLIAIAKKMSGKGLEGFVATSDPCSGAPTRQPVEDGGAAPEISDLDHELPCDFVLGSMSVAPPSSSNRGGEGQDHGANPGQCLTALPVRDPKPQRTPIDFGAASLAIKTKLAISVMDRVMTNDGRSWGAVRIYELDSMARDGAMARGIKNHLGVLSNEQHVMSVRELINDATFEAIRSKAHGA